MTISRDRIHGAGDFPQVILVKFDIARLAKASVTKRLNTSHVLAHQVVRQLLTAIGLPNLPKTAQNGVGYGI